MSTIYILLPVYNRKHITQKFIECLNLQTFEDYQLVVIDDGSTDGTSDMVREYIPNATVLEGNGNLWWAGGLQKGIDWLKENAVQDNTIVLFINDDVTFESSYLEDAVRTLNDRSNLLLLSKFSCDNGKSINESGVVADLKRLTFRIARPGEEINCLSTRGLFVRFGDIKRIGNFYPRILPHYLSDYEYTIRAIGKGLRCETTNSVYLCPSFESTGYHKISSVSFLSFLRKYFSIKSAINPFYMSVFVFLAVPKLWIFPNLIRIWYRTSRMIVRQMINTMRHNIRYSNENINGK